MDKVTAQTSNGNNELLDAPYRPAPAAAPPGNPFDPKSLRLGQDFAASVGVRKALLTIPVRKPDRQTFFRVHPHPEFSFNTALLVLKEERNEVYLVDKALWSELSGDVTPHVLMTALTRQNTVFLLPISLPGSDGKWNEWSRSMFEAAEMAKTTWIKAVPNMQLGAREVFEATGDLPEPDWVSLIGARTLADLLKIAFKDRFIASEGHPVVRKLRGEV